MAFLALATVVVLGIMAGGLIALALIGPRRHQNSYSIAAAVGLALGAAATLYGNTVDPRPLLPAVLDNLLNLALSAFLGYAVTAFFVLSYHVQPDVPAPDAAAVQAAQAAGPDRTAVLYFVPGESEEYDVRVAARGLETADYPDGLPPMLLRPFYLLGLKRKYTAVQRNPYRATHFRLAQKVQDRLGKRYKVYMAFYNDQPGLADAAAQAIGDGTRRLIVLHPRLTNPPPAMHPAALLAGLRPGRYGVSLVEAGPLWNADLLARVFVRQALAATTEQNRAATGLLLIGQGHPAARRAGPDGAPGSDPLQRQNQELTFQKRVRQALIRVGFRDDHVTVAWLRWQEPGIAAAGAQLAADGCRRVFWTGSSLLHAGLPALYDIPRALQAAADGSGVEVAPLGPWVDDDVVAEALVEKVRQAGE